MRILVVDDEAASRTALELIARRLDYEVDSAADGDEAWESWRRHRHPVVITDCMMPGLNGVDLTARIRDASGDDYTYIIMVTVLSDVEAVVEGLEAGADDYLAKPFRQEELQLRLRGAERVLQLQSKEVVIFSLAKLAESRDPETGEHLERIRHYSRTLAQTIQGRPGAPAELDTQVIGNLFLTAPLHDIGKVGIPDAVLLKPGRLEADEFEVMKTHSIIGFNALEEARKRAPRAGYLRVAADVARSHHEKYDGTGYPDGLQGDAIPLTARIVALADVYDALVSKRVYKEAFSHEKAVGIIMEGRGRHFDPLVVDAFDECQHAFTDIHASFPDS